MSGSIKSTSKNNLAEIPALESSPIEQEKSTQDLVRPPIDYSSFSAFVLSTWARFKSLWTKRFIWSLLAGQLVSFCITATSVATTELVNRNWSLPTTQTFFL